MTAQVREAVARLRDEMERQVARRGGVSEIIRDGYQVVIIGPPNAGKSSLLKRAGPPRCGHRLRHAGTTRDVV